VGGVAVYWNILTKSGGLHEKHVEATWKAGTISAFALGPRETNKQTKKTLEMAGRRAFRILTYSQLFGIKVKAVIRPKYNLHVVMIQCTRYKNYYTFKASNDSTHKTKLYAQIQLNLQLVIKIFYM
jgi:hypothetical protein